MDGRFFLEQRLSFVRQLYADSTKLFADRKRQIELGNDPYVPQYDEGPEPPFLTDWLEAENSLQVLGQACVSMLSASLHLYLKLLERKLNRPVNDKYIKDFKRGWLNGYKAYFLGEFRIAFEDSRCNLHLLEELVLARNRVQHPASLTTQSVHYSDQDLRRFESPFFIRDSDIDLFSKKEEGERYWLMPPAIHITSEKFSAALTEVARFADWLESLDIDKAS